MVVLTTSHKELGDNPDLVYINDHISYFNSKYLFYLHKLFNSVIPLYMEVGVVAGEGYWRRSNLMFSVVCCIL